MCSTCMTHLRRMGGVKLLFVLLFAMPFSAFALNNTYYVAPNGQPAGSIFLRQCRNNIQISSSHISLTDVIFTEVLKLL